MGWNTFQTAENACKRATDHFGGIDMLVNNAGIGPGADLPLMIQESISMLIPATSDYQHTIVVMASAGLLLVMQLVVADLSAILQRHKAGYPIPADSNKFIFRAAWVHANTNESIAAFALLSLSAMLLSASPPWVNALSVAWLACRLAHMGFYYANIKMGRSIAFGLSLLTLLGLFVCVASAFR